MKGIFKIQHLYQKGKSEKFHFLKQTFANRKIIMGIRGLTTFAKSAGLCETIDIPLSPTNQASSPIYSRRSRRLVIDGSALVYFIFQQCLRTRANCLFGDCAALMAYTKSLFNLFKAAGFEEIYVILDGAYVPEKLKTEVRRERQKIGRSGRTALCMMPVFLYRPFARALKESGIWFRICVQEEADVVIGNLALTLDAMVLSNDSDFMIFPSRGYICLRELIIPDYLIQKFQDPDYIPSQLDYLTLNVYRPHRLAQYLKFSPRWLPLFACIAGNDFRTGMTGKKNGPAVHECLRKIANGISSAQSDLLGDGGIHQVDDAVFIAKVLEKLDVIQPITDELLECCEFYLPQTIEDFRPESWIAGTGYRDMEPGEAEMMLAIENGIIPRKLASIGRHRTFWCSVYPSPLHHPSPWDITANLRRFLYSLVEILKGKSPNDLTITEFKRVANDFRPVEVEAMSLGELEDLCGHLQPFPISISGMKSLPEKQRIQVLQKLFHTTEVDFNHEHFALISILKHMHREFSGRSLILNRDHPFVLSIVASVVLLIREPNLAETEIDYETRCNLNEIDRSVLMSAFQNVLHHYLMIVDCLGLEDDIDASHLNQMFNGTFIHYFWSTLDKKSANGSRGLEFTEHFPCLKRHGAEFNDIVSHVFPLADE